MSIGPLPSASIDRWIKDSGTADHDDAGEAVACFRAMDAVFRGIEAAPKPEAAPSRVSARPMSVELIDALFGT